ncbi:acyltransferase family protein [Bradyrhizobium sp. USDA 4448]
MYWGRLAVQCFFVLSGFLITSILIRESETASSFRPIYVSFISRRALRLYPLLLVTLTVCAVLGINVVRDGFLWHVTYLTNLYVINVDTWPNPVSPLWSLAVEEQFYYGHSSSTLRRAACYNVDSFDRGCTGISLDLARTGARRLRSIGLASSVL